MSSEKSSGTLQAHAHGDLRQAHAVVPDLEGFGAEPLDDGVDREERTRAQVEGDNALSFARRKFFENHNIRGFRTSVVTDRVKAGLAVPLPPDLPAETR